MLPGKENPITAAASSCSKKYSLFSEEELCAEEVPETPHQLIVTVLFPFEWWVMSFTPLSFLKTPSLGEEQGEEFQELQKEQR